MAKVLLATDKPFASEAVKGIEDIFTKAGFELIKLEKYGSQDILKNEVKGIDAIIIRSDIIDKDIIDSADKLKIVVRAGAGYDNVDLEAATAKGVTVMNTPGQNSNAVAELTIGMMIYQNRNQFNGTSGVELRGKRIGMHGFGNVGKLIATYAKGIGMDVSAYDPHIKKEIFEEVCGHYVDNVEDLYRFGQYIVLTIPAIPETIKSVNYDLMSLMRKGATLVNPARKEVIDEESLLKMFVERPDFRYIADIKPDCADEIAAKYPGRYYFTPKKMGAQTAEANINAGLAAANQIVGFINNGDSQFKVN